MYTFASTDTATLREFAWSDREGDVSYIVETIEGERWFADYETARAYFNAHAAR